jgi:predicted transglutaminase-like cysteine proteinase
MAFRLGLAFLALTTAFASPAFAIGLESAAMRTGSVTSQPIGHYEFCQSHQDECSIKSTDDAAPKLTSFGWQTVRDINYHVNSTIVPMTDMELYGREEVWAYPVDAGDCEDFVLLKRRMLIEKGFPVNDLLITVVRKPDGEGHAVLTVRTSQGDFILDNLGNEVKLWTDTSYHYLKRQSTTNSGQWVTIENGSDVLVGSLNK